jgi:peptidoglycan/xylan/chitin deacetylase (PgdA/CDA1 family)
MSRFLRGLRDVGASFAASDILVLCYHEVRSRERFQAQMSALLERGYSVVTMEEVIEWSHRGQPIASPAVLLTFDGGYRSQLDNAVPALEALKLPATFFPMSAGLDDSEISGRALAALAAQGHTIGCHTHTHPDLTMLHPAALEREVADSRRVLEDVVGRPVTAFCYPYGARSSRVIAAVRSAGFEVAFTVDLGGVSAGDDPYQLRRIPILGEPGRSDFAAFIRGRRFVAGGILVGWKIRERLLDRALARSRA